MELKEKPTKDPIKDKYNQKVGFFKKIKIYFNKKTERLKSKKDFHEDVDSFKEIVLSILTYGVIGGFASTLVGYDFSILSFISVGCFLWLVENKFVEFITRILSSLNLVKVYK
jgi:hypothetical protein